MPEAVGKRVNDVNDTAVSRPRRWRRRLVDRRLRLERGDQVLIAAISGATPRIVIILLML